ncbi:MAG: hypothetical protein WKF82_10965 [Nocardioidaceae bacterium]
MTEAATSPPLTATLLTLPPKVDRSTVARSAVRVRRVGDVQDIQREPLVTKTRRVIGVVGGDLGPGGDRADRQEKRSRVGAGGVRGVVGRKSAAS